MTDSKLPVERPILFNAEMVKALLSGVKTQTRRLIKPQPPENSKSCVSEQDSKGCWLFANATGGLMNGGYVTSPCRYGVPGDRLWVRETWAVSVAFDSYRPSQLTPHVGEIQYRSGGGKLYDKLLTETSFDVDGELGMWRPSIFMPRWASRLTLEITNIRVERLQDITETDAWAEGCPSGFVPDKFPSSLAWFHATWADIHGKDSWDDNAWVWVVEFKKVDKDEVADA